MNEIMNEVKQGKLLQGTGDNWDYKIRVHYMRNSKQNKDLHYFASNNLILESVPCQGLLKTAPQHNILTILNSMFLLDDTETQKAPGRFQSTGWAHFS